MLFDVFVVGDAVQFDGQWPWRTYYGTVTAVIDERRIRVKWDDGMETTVDAHSGRVRHKGK